MERLFVKIYDKIKNQKRNYPILPEKLLSELNESQFWEREKLSSNLEMSGPRAKDLLDRDLAECITFSENRREIDQKTRNTKKCAKDGADWKAVNEETFVRQCMREKGWILSNCCAYRKDCACNYSKQQNVLNVC